MIHIYIACNRSDEEHLSVWPGPSGLGFLFLAVLLLAGCNETDWDALRTNHGYGYEYDYVTDLGIQVRNDSTTETPIRNVDWHFTSIAECLGVSYDYADGIMVIFTDEQLSSDDSAKGLYYPSPQLIVVQVQTETDFFITDYVLRHEFVHYLLDRSTGDPDSDHSNNCYPL